ncbi:NPCBM/NEW2 domain-containing protein [Microbispora siamensis]|uniref:Alpha-galactosidase n=1 Tax=Microbispora siamensis TaxID=564413 RepID=A0ABQ4GQ10_9ACTN|nr:NPCBM/NEW2 domain-containing protein [Microbispora siamensis]GIH63533.1 alpha-galactosidase [Microbispora siamensis]
MRIRSAALTAVLLGMLAIPAAGAAARATSPPAIDAPPMGWSSRSLGCSVSETSVRQAADGLAALAAVGYRYVIIDGCWLAPQRDGGALVADRTRFPSGITALADYVHDKGLKLGLALSAGTKACAGGGPGSYDNEAADGALIRSWGVDYLKYDWCSIPTADFPGKNSQAIAQTLYPRMRQALGDTIAFAMNNEDGNSVPWLWGAQVATTWRTNVYNRPITDNYAAMVGIWETDMLRADYPGPRSWADPDLILTGGGGMTETEYRSQFSLWAMGAAPLVLMADPVKAPAAIVANPKVIAVDQDPLGVQAHFAATDGWYHVLVKPLENGDRAVALFNESDRQTTISTTASRLKLPHASAYRVEDLWTGEVTLTEGRLAAAVPAHGVVMYRIGAGREQAPPAVTFEVDPATFLGDDRPSALEPGRENELVTRVTDTGGTDRLDDVEVTLDVPEGWQARALTPARSSGRLGAGEIFTVRWAVTPPAGAPRTAFEIGGRASFGWRGRTAQVSGHAVVQVAEAPARGTTALSDLGWTRATSHLGPVERDTSNGDAAAGDGRPITIEGVRYAQGLGAHAPADIEFYVARRCSEVRFLGGVDDEVGANGSVQFEVWADGERVARSGVITGSQPAVRVSAAVRDARYVRLVVTNAGDNAYFDHADLADATITCD